MDWNFPLLVLPKWANLFVEANFSLSLAVATSMAILGICGLIMATIYGHDRNIAVQAFGFLGGAVLVVVFGMIPILAFANGVVILWYVVWKGLIYWVIWKLFARNLLSVLHINWK